MTPDPSLATLSARFAIPGKLQFDSGQGGLPRIAITTPAATAHVYLHGAHVTHYQPTGQQPLLFLSRQSHFRQDKPIRGGIPICLPWFAALAGNPSAPMHGFARRQPWNVQSTAGADDGSVRVILDWMPDEQVPQYFPHDFRAAYTLSVGPELRLSLEVFNTGTTQMRFTEALHTYFNVADVRRASVEGLQATDYLDKTLNFQKLNQGPHPIIFTGETDRVYLNTRATTVIHDPIGGRNISIAKSNSHNTVVWNPWAEKAKPLPDFGDDEWERMLCVETGNVANDAVTLPPGQSHTMTAVIHSTIRTA